MGVAAQAMGIGPSKLCPHGLFSVELEGCLEDTVGTAAMQSRQVVPSTVAPLPVEHQSVERIKTEMELADLC